MPADGVSRLDRHARRATTRWCSTTSRPTRSATRRWPRLQVYVRDLGKGLVMLGGRSELRRRRLPQHAARGGAAGVHDGSRPRALSGRGAGGGDRQEREHGRLPLHQRQTGRAQQQTRGFEKVDIAKEAILRAADALSPTDQLGVVAFDEGRALGGPHRADRPRPPAELARLPRRRQTNIYAGPEGRIRRPRPQPRQAAAHHPHHRRLVAAPAPTTAAGRHEGGRDHALARSAPAAARRTSCATWPSGPVAATTTPPTRPASRTSSSRRRSAPRASRSSRSHFSRSPPRPSEILRGLDAGRLPSAARLQRDHRQGDSATVALLTGRDDPLLAQWQYGLGRAVAWTSDARQQWATPWIGTDAFGTLAAQLVAWTLPPQDAQGIDVRFCPGRDGELNVEVTSLDDDGRRATSTGPCCASWRPTSSPIQTTLEQVGPGRYARHRARRPAGRIPRPRRTDARRGRTSASRTLGIVSPAAEEFRRLGVDADALAALRPGRQGRRLHSSPTIRGAAGLGGTTSRRRPSRRRSGRGSAAGDDARPDRRRRAARRADPRRLRRARGWVARGFDTASAHPKSVIPGLARAAAADRSGVAASPTAVFHTTRRRAVRAAAPPPPPVGTEAIPPPAPAEAARVPSRSPSPPANADRQHLLPPPAAETFSARLARRRRGGD